MEYKLISADTKDFNEIFSIMEEAFPLSERRTKENQFKLFDNAFYKPHIIKENNVIIGFILAWEIRDFRFIEHFAIDINHRNKGIGYKMLKKYLETDDSVVCLEVEPPIDSISKNRVNFYERLGFKLNDFEYFQPALQSGEKAIELKIMSYPCHLSKEDFDYYTDEIYKEAYLKYKKLYKQRN